MFPNYQMILPLAEVTASTAFLLPPLLPSTDVEALGEFEDAVSHPCFVFLHSGTPSLEGHLPEGDSAARGQVPAGACARTEPAHRSQGVPPVPRPGQLTPPGMPLCGRWPQRIPTLSGGSPALPIYGTPNHRPLCSSSECTESTCRYDRRRLTVIRGGARTRWSTGRCARATQASPRRGRWCFSSFAMVNNLEHSWHAAVLRRVHVGLVTFLGSVQGAVQPCRKWRPSGGVTPLCAPFPHIVPHLQGPGSLCSPSSCLHLLDSRLDQRRRVL